MTLSSHTTQEHHAPLAWPDLNTQCSQSAQRGELSPFDQSDTQPSSTSPARVFSPISSPSSQSSLSDADSSLHQDTSSQSNVGSYNNVETSSARLRHPQAIGTSNIRLEVKSSDNPRRTQARPSWIRPALVRQDQRRQQLVEQLVDAATQLVLLIWPESDATKAIQNRVISLRFFIRETLRRSRTSYSTLQVTLWYLILIKPHVSQSLSQSASEQPDAPNSHSRGQLQGAFCGLETCRPLQCGRRMFLSALILASKFLQDRNFTARAWSKITGLATQEIISNEFLFLTKISWNLHLKEQDFAHWNSIIIRCTESTQLGRNVKDTWSTVLECAVDRNYSLDETARFLATQHRQPVTFTHGESISLEQICGNDMGYSDEDPGFSNFTFASQPSPFSSASPLVVSDECRIGISAARNGNQMATPHSLSSSCSGSSPVSDMPITGASSSQPNFDCSGYPNYPSQRSHGGRGAAIHMLTPSPSISADRPDEDCRSVYGDRNVAQVLSSPLGVPRGVHDGPAMRCNSASAQGKCLFGPKLVHQTASDKAMRAMLTPQARQASAGSGPQGQASGCASRSKLSEAEFCAAITQEYRRQKQSSMSTESGHIGQKRNMTDDNGCRRMKSRCLEMTPDSQSMTTPVAPNATLTDH